MLHSIMILLTSRHPNFGKHVDIFHSECVNFEVLLFLLIKLLYKLRGKGPRTEKNTQLYYMAMVICINVNR